MPFLIILSPLPKSRKSHIQYNQIKIFMKNFCDGDTYTIHNNRIKRENISDTLNKLISFVGLVFNQ